MEQRIAQVQGVFTQSWTDAAEYRSPGPAGAADPSSPGGRSVLARSRTLATDIFLASLFADAIAVLLDLRSPNALLSGLSAGLTVVQLASAIWIFVQHNRGLLRTAMQRLAIAALVFVGAVTYAQAFADSFEAAMAGARRAPMAITSHPLSGAIRPIYCGGVVLLGIAGLVLSFQSTEPQEPPVTSG